ncbi:hypothetical protein B296_00038489, partial [Ensete ventricosum]
IEKGTGRKRGETRSEIGDGDVLRGGGEVRVGRIHPSPNPPPRIGGHHPPTSSSRPGTKTLSVSHRSLSSNPTLFSVDFLFLSLLDAPQICVLGSRIGYLPLLLPLIKPYFSSTLPPGEDTVWFDYNGLPLKWFVLSAMYVPIGVLFDLLCAEPERPWNLTV